MIKIKEVNTDQVKKGIGKIEVRLENREVVTFESYPVVVNSKDLKYIHYEIQKKQDDLKDRGNEKHGIIDKAKQKALEVKDTVADVKAILDGKIDSLRAEDVLFIGTLKDIEHKLSSAAKPPATTSQETAQTEGPPTTTHEASKPNEQNQAK